VPKHDDVRTFPPQGDHAVDVICGGFPCQDISLAGKGAGLAGARSGLWYEFARIIGDIRPRYVIVENVAALLSRGMATVLGDLSTLGYDAEWHVISAAAVGAPHRRDRVWIVAVRNANSKRETCDCLPDSKHGSSVSTQARRQPTRVGSERHVAESECVAADKPDDLAMLWRRQEQAKQARLGSCGIASGRHWWATEPDVGRVAHGVPSWVDRLRCLGNAVVPQIVEVIGRQIIAHEERVRTGRQRS
jgi:DNA (cytosine-5)-methyltransferase 1